MKKPNREIERLNYTLLAMLGFLQKNKEGATAKEILKYLADMFGITRQVTIYEYLQNLEYYAMVEKRPQRNGKINRPANKYFLTKKGLGIAIRYNANIILNNPPLHLLKDLT